ncbi:MAG: hypothetical protein ABFQ64_00135 [Campylobacterota bacterium]
MKFVFISLLALLMMSGCSKKEFRDNLSNVKQGVKKDWKTVKKSVADSTEEYKDH